jgi:hypothetical protein
MKAAESSILPPTVKQMTTYRVLLPHPLEPRLLLMQTHGEWRLPQWEDASERLWQVTDHVNRAVAARFGVETTVLRCVRNTTDPLTLEVDRVYELENHSAPHEMPGASVWVSASELRDKVIDDPDLLELIGEWFARNSPGGEERGAPWMRRSWYVHALTWTIARLREAGAIPQSAPDQLRSWERSFLMRIHTDIGNYYFKAAPAVFRHEPQLMKWLRDQFRSSIPEVVAIDTDRHWLLLREVEGVTEPLEEVRDEKLWAEAARRLAEIQVTAARWAPELRELGVPNRSLDVLARRIPRLCADTAAMMLGTPCGLTRAQIDHIASLGPTLLALAGELARIDIPDTLEHGDLWSANILMTARGPVFLDWSDSSLSHPFFSLFHLMNDAASLLPTSSAESRRRLRDAYLEPWTAVAPMDQLTRAFEIARILAPVHLAAIAHAELVPSVGYDREVMCSVPENLRYAIDLLLAET